MAAREAWMVIDRDGKPGRLCNPDLAPIRWTRAGAAALAENMDGLCDRVGMPGKPHSIQRITIETSPANAGAGGATRDGPTGSPSRAVPGRRPQKPPGPAGGGGGSGETIGEGRT